jgi:hypothetical protein
MDMNSIPPRLALIAAALACHGCGRAPGEGSQAARNAAAGAMAPAATPAGPQADINASLALDPFANMADPASTTGTGALPPADAPLRFVGRWAAERAQCENAAWRFTADRLTTPAGSACTFDHVEKVPGGYDIAARCTAEGPERADTIRLRFAESARAMLFESDTIADAGLVYCGG